jgi:pyruvate dehydrogenase E2 component (dihydrolipoamide acetyltransferase)
MPTNILMPALSPTMTEGTLARWLKQEGDTITAGDVIAEIETDKATMEVEAVDEGVLTKILVPAGAANVKVNVPIGIIAGPGEAPAPSAGAPAPAVAPAAASPAPSNGHEASRPAASPLARRLAAAGGLDLAGVKGSGPGGRIVRADLDQAQSKLAAAPPPASPQAASPPPQAAPKPPAAPAPKPASQAPQIAAPHRLVPHSSMRRVIARRLAEAKQTIPHFYLTTDIEIDALLKLRADLNLRSPRDGAGSFKLSVNDLVIKACATSLRQMPTVNASYTEAGTVFYDDVDISVAVSIPDGLITPIIRQADRKGLATISTEMKDLATRARAGKLKPDEYQGGGFSISNLGMFGIRDFAAVINPPQGAILAVGAGEQRAVVRDGNLAVATVMTVTLSVDHRAIDGALGAEFLANLKSLIQAPLGLLL